MKKLFMLGIVMALLLCIPMAAFGLTSPSVSEGHGVLSGMFITPNTGFSLSAEYGLSPQFAVIGAFGLSAGTNYKVGIKYELNPNLALLGGLTGPGSSFFLGINAGTAFGKKLYGMGEVDLSYSGGGLSFGFEAGAKYALTNQLDIRAGVIGSTTEVGFEIGVGFKF